MNAAVQRMNGEYAAALLEYLAKPQESTLMQAYDLGRRALILEVGLADLEMTHGKVLALAMHDAGTPEERALLTRRAAEFLGETLASLQMILRGYREANALLQDLNETLEQRVQARTAARKSEDHDRDLFDRERTMRWC